MSHRLLDRVDRWFCRCERCGHSWEATGKLPTACASCKHKGWDRAPKAKGPAKAKGAKA